MSGRLNEAVILTINSFTSVAYLQTNLKTLCNDVNHFVTKAHLPFRVNDLIMVRLRLAVH